MSGIHVPRRSFLAGCMATFGLGGWRLFAAPPGWKPPENPRLVFGVISDTHLRTRHVGPKIGANWPDKYLVAAFEYFREQNVDAVAHCGDMAHRGQVEELQFHANAWNRVFPKNRAPDGHEVVKLFVSGNHDAEGSSYGDFVEKRYPDPVKRAAHVLATDMAANWERIWGEKYEPAWHKEVKGFHFFGRHWGVDFAAVSARLKGGAEKWGLAQGSRPFFYLHHQRPSADARKQLLPYRNAVCFFGHNHWSAANWNMAYLYYNALPVIEVPSCEPRGCTALVGDDYISKAKLEGREAVGKGRQGYVVRVYDDMMAIARREFGEGGSLGADWIMPLERKAGPHPLQRNEMKKRIGEPQFRDGAQPVVRCEAEAVKIEIPRADGNPDSRTYAYDVVIAGDSGKLHKAVYAAGCNLGMGHEPEGGKTTLAIPRGELPQGQSLICAVRPLTSLGTFGRAVSATFSVSGLAAS